MGLSTQVLPSVAFSGEAFFTAWTEEREGRSAEIFGAHLESGALGPDSPSYPVSNTPKDDLFPSVGWDGERYLTAWSYFTGDDLSGVYGARVAPNGGVLDTQTDLSKSGYSEAFKHGSDIACLPGNCLVVYPVGLGGTLVRTDGLALEPQILDLDSALYCGNMSVAPGVDEFFAVCNSGSHPNWDISGLRLSASGEVLDIFSVAGGLLTQVGPEVAWNGNGYFVIWREADELYGARVDSNWAVLDPLGIRISEPGRYVAYPEISWGGTDYLVAWLEEESEDVWNLMASRINEDGVVLDRPGILLAQGLDLFSEPAVAGDGTGRWLVGYSRFDHDSEDPGHRIFGRYFSSLHDGVSCSQGDECRSGFCVDGICCDAACSGQCEACDLEESPGVCLPVTGSPHGQRLACAGTGVCRATCGGVNPDSCTYPGAEVRCAEGICLEGVQYDPAYCDRAGNCQEQDVWLCEPYACGVAECKTLCTTDRDCAGGFYCIDGACDTARSADGCGCGARDSGSAGIWLLVIVLAGLARRRAS
jgi:MYXO-CTERM domain-containing protein